MCVKNIDKGNAYDTLLVFLFSFVKDLSQSYERYDSSPLFIVGWVVLYTMKSKPTLAQ